MKGCYCLIISLKRSDKLDIGHLHQDYKFKKGWYVYIGSAMNSLGDVLFNISDEKIECELAGIIAKNGEGVPKFGCSDCKCNSHLIYFKRKKDALESVKNAYDKLNSKYYNLNYFNSKFRNK